jgi:ABC-type amino acid transport substrate-binding protein
VALATWVVSSSAYAADETLYFYSPEFGPSNLSVLTQAVDTFFDDAGLDVQFQPFARLEDFRRKIDTHPPTFLIAPEWAARSECFDEQLTAIVQPTRSGLTSGRRALMAGPSVQSAQQIANGSVAAAVAKAGSDLEDISMGHFRADYPTVNIIPVPKDIDALLAVGFGQVDAAFVSLAQFKMLERVNPNLTANLHEIGYSQKSPFPRLYATARATNEASDMIAAAFGKIRDASGRHMFSILGFDDAKILTGADKTVIKARSGCSFGGGGK